MTEPETLPGEDPTDVDPRPPPDVRTGFRDEPTAAAQTRTVKWGHAKPWLAVPDPEPRPAPRDPLFWPALVFVGVLAASIAFMLLSQPNGHGHRGSGSVTSP